MAALVSHAMRRYPFQHQDGMFSFNLKSEKNAWKTQSGEEGESALSRSMRYADPWLYGNENVPSPPQLFVTTPSPTALILCSCHDYSNGTKKTQKKSPTVCKKCKGTRVSLAGNNGEKFGTVRCYPTKKPSGTPMQTRAGTMRVSSTPSRGSILPIVSPDPYDLMRRSRLNSSNEASNMRNVGTPRTSSSARRSILECDINPYELMSTEPSTPKDTSITLLNGQRIRVRPQAPNPDYEDIEEPVVVVLKPARSAPEIPQEPPSSPSKKSILKKPNPEETQAEMLCFVPKIQPKNNGQNSHFYLPCPNTPRKKVQFLVQSEEPPDYEEMDDVFEEEKELKIENETSAKVCTLRRSTSERFKPEVTTPLVTFLDTMALRTKLPRGDTRDTFDRHSLEKLDGLLTRRKISPRPKDPPPLPPQKTPEETTPQAPPRKRSNQKQPIINIVEISGTEETTGNVTTPENIESNENIRVLEKFEKVDTPEKFENSVDSGIIVEEPGNVGIPKNERNKTIVQVTPEKTIHKIQIKNEFPEINIQTISVPDTSERKTSIMINGDDCYSTVNVNDDIPLYQSSVVVKEHPVLHSPLNPSKSTVYINGNFTTENEEKCNNCKRVTKENNEIVTTTSEQQQRPLNDILRDPVEAIRRNLIPHICGKDSITNLRNRKIFTFENNFDCNDSEDYEFVDQNSDSYTDHSNRSSVTEEELSNRNKFYELLADSALLEVSENDDHHYECISRDGGGTGRHNIDTDPIYEEIEIPPPLPSNPPPVNLLDDLKLDKEFTTRSIFEGASKYDILSYLVDAKERGIVPEDSYTFSTITNSDDSKEVKRTLKNDSSEESSLEFPQKCSEVERNDSGVGSETSKSSLSKYRTKNLTTTPTTQCEDCETILDDENNEPLLCRKCTKRRSERKEIIMEIVETEEKYSKDLQIILEEFYQPMLVAGLLTPEQLSAIFLNVEELLENSQSLAEKLRDAVEIASEQGDEDLLTVNIGKLFLDAAPMLHAFETYCVRQGTASLLLAGLEKEKELLRIFLRVSQMENTLLRRMNLNSFLMVPVQRVTKYPLLLARLYKVTTGTGETSTRDQLKDAQHKIELHLNHMNSQTKDVPTKLWRRIGSGSTNPGFVPGRKPSTEMDLVNIKLRKIAVDVLEWNHDDAKFALEGKLWFTQPTDNNWRKGRTIKLSPVNAMLVINGKQIKPEREENSLVFPKHTATREAALLLVRDKNGRYSLLRDPLYLDRCVIASDPAWQSYFEVQELLGKDTFIFKAEGEDQTKIWYKQLQYHAQGMGAWRKRRNALANIMMNGMGLKL